MGHGAGHVDGGQHDEHEGLDLSEHGITAYSELEYGALKPLHHPILRTTPLAAKEEEIRSV